MLLSQRQLFFKHIGQTSVYPKGLEISRAEGIYLYDNDNNSYIDMLSGVSVSNLGHSNKEIIEAIKNQVDKYMHLMVYGEYIQSPQVLLAQRLSEKLPELLDSVYFVNSGSEAVEGAMKLAKRYTRRSEIFSFKNAYHGSTHGALSVLGDEYFKNSFRPLLPDIHFLNYNNFSDLDKISEKTACVIIEPIQAEAGIILPEAGFLEKLRLKCNEKGALLIFDEIQTGMGRTGKLFCFDHYNVTPDILLLAKAFGGGMPLGAFVSSKEIMNSLVSDPELGHITTFGGHPVSCAAGLASLKILCNSKLIEESVAKEKLFKDLLKNHKEVNSIRSKGLFMAVELENATKVAEFVEDCQKNGIITEWSLFDDSAFRISPPLIITESEIRKSCDIMLACLDRL